MRIFYQIVAKVAFASLLADFVTPKVRYCGPKAETERFELSRPFGLRAFQARALDHYATSP